MRWLKQHRWLALVIAPIATVYCVQGLMPERSPHTPQPISTEPVRSTSGARPVRIVSLNLCTDQILLQLVDKARIAALSRLAHNPDMAMLAQEAEGIAQVSGSAEEVLALQPDLVLVGNYTTRHTTQMLRYFDIPVLVVPGADSMQDVYAQMRLVARSTGDEARAESAIAAMQRQEQALAQQIPAQPSNAAMYGANSYSAGKNTIYDTMLRLGGWSNAAAKADLQGYGRLPLEKLIEQHPEMLLTPNFAVKTLGQSAASLQHPILHNMDIHNYTVPSKMTVCGGPWNLEAAALLAAQRKGGA